MDEFIGRVAAKGWYKRNAKKILVGRRRLVSGAELLTDVLVSATIRLRSRTELYFANEIVSD